VSDAYVSEHVRRKRCREKYPILRRPGREVDTKLTIQRMLANNGVVPAICVPMNARPLVILRIVRESSPNRILFDVSTAGEEMVR